MEKIKNAFKPDVQKEAEAKKASEETTQSDQTTTTSTTATSSSTPQQNPVSSNDLEQQPTTSTGTGGGLTETTESKYGATPGHGVSSYQTDTSPSTERTLPQEDTTGSSQAYGSTIPTNAPQIGATNAPQIGRPDLGESVAAGYGIGSGNGPSYHLLNPGDDASTASIKSGLVGSGLTSFNLGTTPTTMPDRSLPTTTTAGQSAYASGTHPTFTGNRLDPAIQDSSITSDYTRGAAIGTGVAATGAAGTAVTYQSSQSGEITDNTGTTHGTQPIEEKKGGLTSLLHRDNPNKLHKEPKGGYAMADSTPAAVTAPVVATTTTAAPATRDPEPSTTTGTATSSIHVKPAAHETFVKPGYHHEHHMGVDGQIGRPTEVSGVHGTDARRTSVANEIDKTLDPSNADLLRPEDKEPTLAEREASLGEGRVIDPITGLVKNVGKFGTGAGGTDGAPQIHGHDATTQAERLSQRDQEREANKELNWDKVRDAGQGF